MEVTDGPGRTRRVTWTSLCRSSRPELGFLQAEGAWERRGGRRGTCEWPARKDKDESSLLVRAYQVRGRRCGSYTRLQPGQPGSSDEAEAGHLAACSDGTLQRFSSQWCPVGRQLAVNPRLMCRQDALSRSWLGQPHYPSWRPLLWVNLSPQL